MTNDGNAAPQKNSELKQQGSIPGANNAFEKATSQSPSHFLKYYSYIKCVIDVSIPTWIPSVWFLKYLFCVLYCFGRKI